MFRSKKSASILPNEKDLFKKKLSQISDLLSAGGHPYQSELILEISKLLEDDSGNELFIQRLNSVDIWGGAGAVWEVYFEDESLTSDFENAIIDLIDLMEETNVLGRGIKRIRKIFRENR